MTVSYERGKLFFPHYIVKLIAARYLLCVFCLPSEMMRKSSPHSRDLKKKRLRNYIFSPFSSSHDFAWREKKRKMIFCLCEEHEGIRPEHTSEFKMSIGYWFYDSVSSWKEKKISIFPNNTMRCCHYTNFHHWSSHILLCSFLFKCLQALSCKQTVQTLL